MDLQPYYEQILALDPINEVESFHNRNWYEYNYENDIIQHQVQNISNEYPNGISRLNIINHFRNNQNDLLKGFLMSMIWGHGVDNRGPWKVSKMFANYQFAIDVLNNAAISVIHSDLIEAHKSFKGMPRIRVNYFSKYLYFLGRGLNLKIYPLIFDNRVASSICRLNFINSDFFEVLAVNAKTDAVSYNQYNKYIYRISEDLNLSAEKIEYFLFLGN